MPPSKDRDEKVLTYAASRALLLQCWKTFKYDQAIAQHSLLDFARMPLFTSPTDSLNFTEAVEAAKTFENPPITNVTSILHYHDYMRIFAEHEYTEANKAEIVFLIQGLVFVLLLFASQVFLRVSRLTFLEVAKFNITIPEICLVVSVVALVLLAMAIGAMNSKQLAALGWFSPFVLLLAILLFIATYKVCSASLHGKSQAVANRPRRKSVTALSSSRVHPHPHPVPSALVRASASNAAAKLSEALDKIDAQEERIKQLEDLLALQVESVRQLKSLVSSSTAHAQE